MAKSSKRTKRPSAFSGIPQRIVDMSPREWPDDKRARWCRAYLQGATKPDAPAPSRMDRDYILAYRAGQVSAPGLRAEVAQVADTGRTNAKRRERHEEQRERALMRSRGDLLGRLDGLERMMDARNGFGSPHDDPTIRALAGAALGAGAMLIPTGTRGR